MPFTKPQRVITDFFGYDTRGGGWRIDRHPRFMADTTGSGSADIVGFKTTESGCPGHRRLTRASADSCQVIQSELLFRPRKRSSE